MTTASSIFAFLRKVDPFSSLDPAALQKLSASAAINHFAKGETIFTEGDAADSVWVLQRGRLQIFRCSSTGRRQAIESLLPKELFGTLCRLGVETKTYPCTAVAATPISAVRIRDQMFFDFFRKSPSMILAACELCSRRMSAMKDLQAAGAESVERRMAGNLLRLSQTHGETLSFTRRELAELIGTSIETAIRTLSRFRKNGWVTPTPGGLRVSDPKELQKLLEPSRLD